MNDLQNLLDQIDRLDQQATKEPWHVALEEDENGVKFPWAIFGPKNGLWGAQGWGDEHYIQEIPELTIPDAELIALARTALSQLAAAVRGVLDVLDGYTMPGKLHDPTGIAGAELESLEQYIREAITDAIGGDDD